MLSEDASATLPDLSVYPPAPVLWVTYSLDNLCSILFRVCANWREALNVPESSVFHAKVPSLSSAMPPMLSFDDYRAQHPDEPWWQQASSYALFTPSTALGDLSTPTAITALFITVLAIRGIKRLLLPLFCHFGRIAAAQTHGTHWIKRHPERIAKFGEYVFRLVYHSLISMLGIYWFWKEPWWQFRSFIFASFGTNSSNDDDMSQQAAATLTLFAGFPYHAVSPQMAWYYLLQAAYNLDALISLLELSFVWTTTATNNYSSWRLAWSPHVRGDFVEMLLHHVVTNLLVIGSSKCRLTRIGSMIFLIHDLSDVPVDLSKLANFVKFKVTTVTSFTIMVAVWCWTRLYLLPFVCYRAVLTQSHYVTQEGLDPLLYLVYRHPFYVLVAFLILLHVSWFGMFLQIFHSIIVKRKVQDLSEHKQGESDVLHQYEEEKKEN